MNGNQNNIGGPAPLPGEPETQPQAQPREPEPIPVIPSSPPPSSFPQPLEPPQPRIQPTGPGPAIPSSPPPDIGIRTMASDLSSLKSSGGFEVKPETFRPEEFNKEPMFESREAAIPSSKGAKPVSAKPHSRVLFVSLGIIGFVIVAGLVIYFFVMPLIFPKEEASVVETPPPVETPPAETATLPLIHQTYFVTSPASTMAMNLNNLNLVEVNSALNAASSGTEPQTVREVTFTVAGAVPEAADFLSLIFPELNKEFLVSSFERDFTVFLYRDNNGSWPGYVFRLGSNTAIAQAADVIKTIETSTNIPNLYLTDLGAPSPTGFKDGLKIGETSARYLSFNTTAASFNYGWFNNHLVVSTSFYGFKEGLKLLGHSSQ